VNVTYKPNVRTRRHENKDKKETQLGNVMTFSSNVITPHDIHPSEFAADKTESFRTLLF
jgi:hypothetical protein